MHVKSIILKTYERILAEAKKKDIAEKLKPTKKKLNKPKEEAPDDAILGNYAFANVRQGIPPEVNTEVEDDLEQELTTHFVNNMHMSAKSGRALKTSLENDWYEKILSEPEQTIVYRGIKVSEAWMANNIGENWKKQFAKAKGQLKINMVLRPNTGDASSAVTSWTKNINTAKSFSKGAMKSFNPDTDYNTQYSRLVCCAAIKDNPNQFIDSAAGLYGIPEFGRYADEQEVLGIGSIKVSQIIRL